MAIYQVLYWKHIPAQIRVFDGKKPLAFEMPPRFQQEIDRVAMAEGLAGTDAYLNAWQWSQRMERPGSATDIAPKIIEELVRAYDALRSSSGG